MIVESFDKADPHPVKESPSEKPDASIDSADFTWSRWVMVAQVLACIAAAMIARNDGYLPSILPTSMEIFIVQVAIIVIALMTWGAPIYQVCAYVEEGRLLSVRVIAILLSFALSATTILALMPLTQ